MRRIEGKRDEDERLWVYDGIIRCYLRYVAIRCAELTNSKEEAGRIACGALVKTCLLVEQLEHAGQIGRVVDKMVDAGGKEMLGERRRVEGAETSGGELLGDERMRTVAAGVNKLDGLTRELLVLYHVEMMDAVELSRIFERPLLEILRRIGGGQVKVWQYLREVWPGWFEARGSNVVSLVRELGSCVDWGWAEGVRGRALVYLAEWGEGQGHAID